MKSLAAIAVMALLSCWPSNAQGGRRFTLSGTILDGVSNRPIAGVEVTLQTEKWEAVGDPITADAEGRFAFNGLAAGEYILSTAGSGFGTVTYGITADPGWVSTVRVGANGKDKSIVFPIFPRGSLEGVIRDEFGDPIMRANVSILRPVWNGGKSTVTTVAQKTTDDRGRYRFGNLAPGSYIVCAGQDGGVAPAPGLVDFAAHPPNRAFTRTCSPAYGGSPPRTMQLAPGQRAQVDLIPMTAPAVTVRGRVRGATGPGFSVSLASDDGLSGQRFGGIVEVAQDNVSFAVRGVPPGRYRLRVDSTYGPGGVAAKHLSAEIPVDVNGTDVDGLEVVLDSDAAVALDFPGIDQAHIDQTKVNATLRREGMMGGAQGAARLADGSFQFQGLPPGRYRIAIHTSSEVCVASVKLGDREVRGLSFEIAPGAALHASAILTRNCGSVELRAVRESSALPGAKAVLLVSGTPQNPGDIVEDFADDEGTCTFSGLTPGRYLMWAWAAEGKDAMAGPASLAAVEQQATVVEVTAGDTVQVDVPVLKEGSQAP